MNISSAIKNLTRRPDDPALAPVPSIIPPTPSANPLEGHDVAIYIDGKRRTHTRLDVEIDNGVLVILMETSLSAALNDDVDATTSLAWNNFKPMEVVNVAQPGKPTGGVFQIEKLVMPEIAGGEVLFEGVALTTIYDLDSGTKIADPQDQCTIPAAFCRKQV